MYSSDWTCSIGACSESSVDDKTHLRDMGTFHAAGTLGKRIRGSLRSHAHLSNACEKKAAPFTSFTSYPRQTASTHKSKVLAQQTELEVPVTKWHQPTTQDCVSFDAFVQGH